jgi:hypothetical protein
MSCLTASISGTALIGGIEWQPLSASSTGWSQSNGRSTRRVIDRDGRLVEYSLENTHCTTSPSTPTGHLSRREVAKDQDASHRCYTRDSGMESFRFFVSSEASLFIYQTMLANESHVEYVVTIAPQTEAGELDFGKRTLAEAIAEMLRDHRNNPKTMTFGWVVGASRRVRFPDHDIFLCDDVPCFVPEEMRPILHGRTLALVDNQLRIQPEPLPPTALLGQC